MSQATSRHRRRSSSLFALESLETPSPPLSPSVSNASCRTTDMFGEIPIIFDFLTTNSTSSVERLSKMASLKPSLPPLAKFSPMSAFFPMSCSTDTLNTIGTHAFGTIRPGSYCFGNQRYSVFSDASMVDSPLEADFDVPSPTIPMAPSSAISSQNLIAPSESTPGVQILDYDDGQKKLGDVCSAYLASPSVCADALVTTQPSDSNATTTALTLALSSTENVPLRNSTDNHLSTAEPRDKRMSNASSVNDNRSLMTIQYAAIRDAASPTSSCQSDTTLSPGTLDFDDKTPTQATFLKRQAHAKPLSRPSSRQDLHSAVVKNPSIRTSSSASEIGAHFRYPPLEQKRRPVTTYFSNDDTVSTIDERSGFSRAVDPLSPGPATPLPVPCLKHAQWLRDTVVELWIDQEGFRAIRPKFYLASVSNGLPYAACPRGAYGSLDGDPLLTTVAEFLPVARTAHFFHHAPLDRAPTLNRITANGDETRDYIARAATLVLRGDGVFFVHGTEDLRIDPGAAGGAGGAGRVVRLNWRFEYFVSSRRPDGRSAHRGEKVLTPLSFSCTPALLDRARASKVKVLHIVKKTLLPNLVAQKLEPPDLPAPLPPPPASNALASAAAVCASDSRSSVCSQRSQKGSTHVLAKTGARIRRASASSSSSSSDSAGPLLAPPRSVLPYRKHRRGSHSETATEGFLCQRDGARHERARSASSFDHGHGAGRKSPSAIDGAPERFPPRHGAPLVGPIIPREELLKMFDTESEARVGAERRPNSIHLEVVNNVQVTVLPAPPRSKHHAS